MRKLRKKFQNSKKLWHQKQESCQNTKFLKNLLSYSARQTAKKSLQSTLSAKMENFMSPLWYSQIFYDYNFLQVDMTAIVNGHRALPSFKEPMFTLDEATIMMSAQLARSLLSKRVIFKSTLLLLI